MKIICPKCNGKKVKPDMTEVVFTFGLSLLIDKIMNSTYGWEKCRYCSGKGSIKICQQKKY